MHRPARFTGDFPARLDDQDLSVRLEMKLDLRVERSADGEITLAMDPGRKPEITLRSQPGRLDFTVQDLSLIHICTVMLIRINPTSFIARGA